MNDELAGEIEQTIATLRGEADEVRVTHTPDALQDIADQLDHRADKLEDVYGDGYEPPASEPIERCNVTDCAHPAIARWNFHFEAVEDQETVYCRKHSQERAEDEDNAELVEVLEDGWPAWDCPVCGNLAWVTGFDDATTVDGQGDHRQVRHCGICELVVIRRAA